MAALAEKPASRVDEVDTFFEAMKDAADELLLVQPPETAAKSHGSETQAADFALRSPELGVLHGYGRMLSLRTERVFSGKAGTFSSRRNGATRNMPRCLGFEQLRSPSEGRGTSG